LNGRAIFKPYRLTLDGHLGADVVLFGLNIDHSIDIVGIILKRGTAQPFGGLGVILIDRSVGKGYGQRYRAEIGITVARQTFRGYINVTV
jgi:hypothetical protein